MEKQQPGFDYEAIRKKPLEQLRSGKSLFGKDGAFAPMLQDFLESALDAELDTHRDEQQRSKGNRKNGYVVNSKLVQHFRCHILFICKI